MSSRSPTAATRSARLRSIWLPSETVSAGSSVSRLLSRLTMNAPLCEIRATRRGGADQRVSSLLCGMKNVS